MSWKDWEVIKKLGKGLLFGLMEDNQSCQSRSDDRWRLILWRLRDPTSDSIFKRQVDVNLNDSIESPRSHEKKSVLFILSVTCFLVTKVMVILFEVGEI